MDCFRFLPPAIITVAVVSAMPSPQAPAPRFLPNSGPQLQQQPAPAPRFLPNFQTNPNHNLQNSLAAGGLGLVGGLAATNCIFKNDCNLSFRPSIGGAVDANGQFVPQLGVTTQVGDGSSGVGTTFTGGLQLDQNSQNGVGGFVAGGINNGNTDGVAGGLQTGFGFSQGANGNVQTTSQLGANVQAPQVAGINFHEKDRPIQPTLFGAPIGRPAGPGPQRPNNNPFHALFFG
jgi:hypothetical protein